MANAMAKNESSFLADFVSFYAPMHKPLSLLICIMGVLFNTVNICVLSKKFTSSATYVLLSGLSAAQLMLLVNYIILLSFNFLADTCIVPAFHASFVWTGYKLVNVNANIAFHACALFHTMCINIFRLVAIKLPVLGRRMLGARQGKLCSLFLLLSMPLVAAPAFLTVKVDSVNFNGTGRQCLCQLEKCYDLGYVEQPLLIAVIFWFYGTVLKLLPCLVICSSSIVLIRSLKSLTSKRQQLLSGKQARSAAAAATTTTALPTESTTTPPLLSQSEERKLQQRVRFNKMLVAVSLMCAGVEMPHAALNVLIGVLGVRFGHSVYDRLGDLFEMLTLLYSSVNFVLFCLMNDGFRASVKNLLCGDWTTDAAGAAAGRRGPGRSRSRSSRKRKADAALESRLSINDT